MKIKFIMNADGKKLYRVYYDKKGGLFLDKTKLANDATSDFDTLLFHQKLQIVYKDRLNGLYHLTSNGKRMVLKSKNIGKIRIQNIKLWIYKTHLLLFYVMFYNHKNMLCCQNLSSVSEPPQVIDICKNADYRVQHCSSDIFYILYPAQTDDQIVIRKFTGVWSAPEAICKGEGVRLHQMNVFSENIILETEVEHLS